MANVLIGPRSVTTMTIAVTTQMNEVVISEKENVVIRSRIQGGVAVNIDAMIYQTKGATCAYVIKAMWSTPPIPRSALTSMSAKLLGTIAPRYVPTSMALILVHAWMASSSAINSVVSVEPLETLHPRSFSPLERRSTDKSLRPTITVGSLRSSGTNPESPAWISTQKQ